MIKVGVNDPNSNKTTYKIDIHTSDMDNADGCQRSPRFSRVTRASS